MRQELPDNPEVDVVLVRLSAAVSNLRVDHFVDPETDAFDFERCGCGASFEGSDHCSFCFCEKFEATCWMRMAGVS
jgi:hypothetical protein